MDKMGSYFHDYQLQNSFVMPNQKAHISHPNLTMLFKKRKRIFASNSSFCQILGGFNEPI